MRNTTLRVTLGCALSLGVSVAQVPATKADAPRFEVAAIHPADPTDREAPSGCPSSPVLLNCRNVTLKRCIVGAYRIGPDRVLGGPDWIDTDRFQITGRADRPSDDEGMMAMLQKLLADRFKLVSPPGATNRGNDGFRGRPAWTEVSASE